jgi:RHS repeat-associated protein
MNCSPFMEICSISGDIIQPLRFPGQYYDEETRLHYNWHRYYKPEWGRYVEPEMFTYGELKTNSILNGEVLQYLRNQEIFLINNFRPMYIFSLSSKNLIWNTPPGGKVLLDSLLEEYIKIPQAINLYSYSLNNPLIYTDPSGVYLGKSTINICKSLSQGECGYVASFLTAYITSFGSYRGCFIKICRKKCVSVPSCTSELYCGEIYPPG